MFVYMYILEILNVYYTSYSETSETVLHLGTNTNDTCISSEWVDVWKKTIQYKYTMKTNANGLMQAIFLNQAMKIVKYARKFTTGKLWHVHGFL